MSADGVSASNLPTTVIPKPTAQISDSEGNAFILSVYHRSKPLVQPNEMVAVKLSEAVSLRPDLQSDPASNQGHGFAVRHCRAAFIVRSSGLRCMITLFSLRTRCIIRG